jgi:hypothetical protein
MLCCVLLASLQTLQGVSHSSSRSHTAGIFHERPVNPSIWILTVVHAAQIRLITMTLGGESYLNFMGNEFGCALSHLCCPADLRLLHRSGSTCIAAIAVRALMQTAQQQAPELCCAAACSHPEWIDFPRDDTYDTSTGAFVPGAGCTQFGSRPLCCMLQVQCSALPWQLLATRLTLVALTALDAAMFLPQATAAAWTSAGGGGTWRRTRSCATSSCTPSTAR